MAAFRYSDEQKEFIRQNAPGKYNTEIADLFDARFGTNITERQVKYFKTNNKIKSDVPRKRRSPQQKLFTEEQVDFITQNVKGLSNAKLTDLVNKTFGISITVKQMKAWKKNHGLSSGLKGSEGIAPPNKGTKGVYNVGGNRTSFKPGERPINYKPVGFERLDRDGYTLVKVSDVGTWNERWKHKHKVIWEQANGPIPKGHVVLFADQDKSNIVLDNLILVPQSRLSILNRKGLLFKDANLTRTGLIMADIYKKIGDRKRSKQN